MISVKQVSKIIERVGGPMYLISHKMGKSWKYLHVQICHYRQKNMPFSPKLAKLFLDTVGESTYRGIVSKELYELCSMDYFLSREQFQKFLTLLKCSHPQLASVLHMNKKGFYMVLYNNGGLNFNTTKMLFENYPLEMSKVLTKIQLEIIFDHL